ncbi:MAG: tetratricopeptide repeat protein, partial [Rhodocyclaceae bacterium]
MLNRLLLLTMLAWMSVATAWAQVDTAPFDDEIPSPPATAETLSRLAEVPRVDATTAELLAFYGPRANEARRFGLAEQELALVARLADLAVGTPQEGHYRIRHYGLLLRAGRLAEAARVRDAFLADARPAFGAKASLCFHEAAFRATLWQMVAARKYFDLGVDFLRRLPPAADGNLRPLFESRMQWARSAILLAEGKLAPAETAIRKALAANQLHLHRVVARGSHAEAGERPEQVALAEWDRANMLAKLVEVLLGGGRPFAAEVVVNDWLQRARQPGFPPNADILPLRKLGDVRIAQGRFADALPLYEQLLSRMKALGQGERSVLVMRTRRQHALALMGLQRWQGAVTEFDALAAGAGNARALQRVIGAGPDRALALLQVGRVNDALSLLDGALARFSRQFGREHPDTAAVEGLRAAALQKIGRHDEALAAYRHAVPILMRPDPSAALRDEHPLRKLRLQHVLSAYVELLHQQYRQDQNPAAADEAFRVADVLRGSRVQEAIVASAGRLAAGDGALATLIRAEQDRRNEIATLYGLLSRQRSGAEIVPGTDLLLKLRQRIETAETEYTALTRQLRERYPAFAELVNPRPPALTELAHLLAPGEAFMAFLT